MDILQVGMLVVLLCLQQTSGKPSSRRDNENTEQCGFGLACGPECQKLCLTQHNYYRALHNLSPVRCDPDLAESAQAWTDMQAQKGQLKRSPWRNLGQLAESISWKQWGWNGMADTRAAVPSAVRSWYSEKKGRIMDRTSVPENFQTIVRPDITRLGCGIHVIPGDGTYVTSHYGATPGGNALNDEIQTPVARDLEPTCQIKSFQRKKCGNISSPYVTPDVCLRAGCCYDDVFKDEPLVLWYRSEGSTWCYKGKNNEKEDQAMATSQDNTLATTSNPVTQVSRNRYDKATSMGNAVDTINSLVPLDKNNKATSMESTTVAPTNIPANQESLENDDDEPKGFFKDCLDHHNKLRAKHGVPPLKWSNKLAANALKTAKMNADIGEMKHATNRKGEGENIYYFGPPQPKCEGPKVGNCFQCRKAVNNWYQEIENYDFAAGKSKGKMILHFTQVVWAKTTLVGMATAIGHNKIYIVGRYWVTGNMGGNEAFIKNVPPPKGPGSTPAPKQPKQPTPESTEGTTSLATAVPANTFPPAKGTTSVNTASVPPTTLATAAPANTFPPAKGTTSANTASVPPPRPSSKPSGISKLVIDCRNNYGDSCYHFNEKGTKWTENREECKKKGGDLVSMETEGEWSFIKDKIQGLSNQLRNEWHIGLTKEGSTWKWVNGNPLTITHWQRGQPSGDGPYAVMAKNYPPGTKGGFNDLPDWIPSGYICEQKKVPRPWRPQPTGAVTSAAAGASSGVKTTSGGEDTAATVIDCRNNYGGSCYHFKEQGTKWTENREKCKKSGGDLVSMETEGEWSFIKDKIQGLNNQLRNEWHIGLTKEGSTWKWVNGAPLTITHWQRGQPSGDGSRVVMAKNYPPGTKGGFNDLPDRMPSGYICEQKEVPRPWRPLPTGKGTSAAATTSGVKTTSGVEETTTAATAAPGGGQTEESWMNVGSCGQGLTCGPNCQLLCLKMHNYYRKLHDAPPMSCDPELAKSAQKWTDEQARVGKMHHSEWTDKFTESISWKSWGWEGMKKMKGAIPGATRSWYSEIKEDYNYATGKGNGQAVGHFRAVVWKGETKIGCGLNLKPGDGAYVTAHYAPASHANANYHELAPKNVLPRKDPEPECDIRSSKRQDCNAELKAPYVTPEECLNAGCCYDDMFMSEPSVKYFRSEGRKWCFVRKGGVRPPIKGPGAATTV